MATKPYIYNETHLNKVFNRVPHVTPYNFFRVFGETHHGTVPKNPQFSGGLGGFLDGRLNSKMVSEASEFAMFRKTLDL